MLSGLRSILVFPLMTAGLATAQQPVQVQEILPTLQSPSMSNGTAAEQCNPYPLETFETQPGAIISCHAQDNSGKFVNFMLYHLIAENSNKRVIAIEADHIILYKWDGNAKTKQNGQVIALNNQGKLLWSHHLAKTASTYLVLGQIAVQATDKGYIIAYFDQTARGETIEGIAPGQLPIIIETLDKNGQPDSSYPVKTLPFPLQPVVADRAVFLSPWRMSSPSSNRGIMVQNVPSGGDLQSDYHFTLIGQKGQETQDLSIILPPGLLANNLYNDYPYYHQDRFNSIRVNNLKFDRDGNLLVIASEENDSADKTRPLHAFQYNNQGKETWYYTIMPDASDTPAGCFYSEFTITPDDRYLILCQQSLLSDYPEGRESNYHQLIAVILNKDGTLFKRFPILTGKNANALNVTAGDAGDILETLAVLRVQFINAQEFMLILHGSDSVFYWNEWKDLMQKPDQSLLQQRFMTRIYHVSW